MHHLFGYIDPGAGSLLIQALVAAVLAVPFFFRRTVSATLGRLRGRKAASTTFVDSKPDDPTGSRAARLAQGQ